MIPAPTVLMPKHLFSACCFPKVLPSEQALEPHLSGAHADLGMERKLKLFCVLGVARWLTTSLITPLASASPAPRRAG
jgi:hypothetical protein